MIKLRILIWRDQVSAWLGSFWFFVCFLYSDFIPIRHSELLTSQNCERIYLWGVFDFWATKFAVMCCSSDQKRICSYSPHPKVAANFARDPLKCGPGNCSFQEMRAWAIQTLPEKWCVERAVSGFLSLLRIWSSLGSRSRSDSCDPFPSGAGASYSSFVHKWNDFSTSFISLCEMNSKAPWPRILLYIEVTSGITAESHKIKRNEFKTEAWITKLGCFY